MSRQSEGEKWAQRGDQHRKVEYDTRRKRMTDPYVQVEVMDLGTTMRNLAARMPEMTEQERVILTVVVAMVALGLLTSCVPVVDTGPHTTVTPDHHPGISTASPAPTHIEATPSPPAVVTATVTRAPRATETKPPVILACTDSAQTLYGKPDKSQVLGPPESWQQSEKTNIKDADGVPIFNDVSVITQNVRKAGLDVAGVVVLEQGGYVAVLKNSEGELVWPQTEVTKADGTKEWQAAARPDGYGKVNKEHVIVIPPPAFGNMGVRMESVTQDGQTGSCAYVVANNGEGKTVGEWNPVTNKWSMIDAMRPTPTEASPEQKYGILVPKDSFWSGVTGGNIFLTDRGTHADPGYAQYRTLDMTVWSTGNVKMVREFNDSLGKNMVSIYGDVVFRDKDNQLQEFENVRILTTDPDYPVEMRTCINETGGIITEYADRCGSLNFVMFKTPEEVFAFYQKAGQPLYLGFIFEGPDNLPGVVNAPGKFTTIMGLANYNVWAGNRKAYQDLAEELKKGTGIQIPKGLLIPAQYAAVYMTVDELMKYSK